MNITLILMHLFSALATAAKACARTRELVKKAISRYFGPRWRMTRIRRSPTSDLQTCIRDRVVISDSGCWEWQLRLAPNGYGQAVIPPDMRAKRGNTQAHRVSYIAFKGAIPAGLTIDHLCRNRCCVNPDHLEVVTNGENQRRALAVNPRRRPGCATHGEQYMVANNRHNRTCGACRRARKQQRKPMNNQQAVGA